MAKILIYAEPSSDSVKTVSLEILGQLSGHEIHVASIGNMPADGLDQLAQYGAMKIHIIKGDCLEKYSPEGHCDALKTLIEKENYDYVFAGSTSLGKDLFPRLAGVFEAGMATEVVQVKMEGDVFKGVRPLLAGKCLADVEITGPKPHFVTVRSNALGLVDSPKKGMGEQREITHKADRIRAKIKDIVKGISEKTDLTEANIIVSGGRAMKNAENFKILNELADILGATVGASRAAVDSGYAPHDMQVGQTGKTVSPTLYIACGISGAIQHLAGMRTSKIIVAVNSDPDAPIFSKADYGLVGDLFKIVPLLTEEFKRILDR